MEEIPMVLVFHDGEEVYIPSHEARDTNKVVIRDHRKARGCAETVIHATGVLYPLPWRSSGSPGRENTANSTGRRYSNTP